MCAYQGVRNVSFSEIFAHVPNEWSLSNNFTLRQKLSKYGVLSGPYAWKYRPEKIPYLDSFYAVLKCTWM